jgi:hypothetical protein
MKPRFTTDQLASLGKLLRERRIKRGFSIPDCVHMVNEWATTHDLEPDCKDHDWDSMESNGHGMSAVAFTKCLVDLGLFEMESLNDTLKLRSVPGGNRTRSGGKKATTKKTAKKPSPKPRKRSRI